ncbi:MAG: glycosyltransferase [Deltaproteobacteria bacterium]|nr:glycosyltransferase [Deltaproteobacteria bacterium]MBW2063788.1 glycosyltransferase [Deltaproteobacteria bacterium]
MTRRSKFCFKILMYSHDTYGLGHIRRTMAIASHLRDRDINTLILTGSALAGQFPLPEQTDFVRIPGMIKMTNEEYLPLSIKINPQHALDIRKNIIKTTAKTFKPHLFIVDKEPLGMKKEVLPTLRWLKRCLPRTRTILGLRDIMDEASVVKNDWDNKGVYEAMEELYDEIWVYGNRELYDPVQEYEVPESASRKMVFTGYIPRQVPSKKAVQKIKRKQVRRDGEKLVVVTAGGGGDGYAMMDTFLRMLEGENGAVPFRSVIITGPFMPGKERDKVSELAKKLGVRTWNFYPKMEEILAAADLVVTMGGYNTLCEILTLGTVSLIIPRDTPRKEQLIRARIFSEQKMVDYLPWDSFTPSSLREKVFSLLDNPKPYQDAMSQFPLTGLDVISERLQACRNKCK